MAKRIGVLTSGGDAPGMNAAIRTVVRAAIHYIWSLGHLSRLPRIDSWRNGTSKQPLCIRVFNGGTILKCSF